MFYFQEPEEEQHHQKPLSSSKPEIFFEEENSYDAHDQSQSPHENHNPPKRSQSAQKPSPEASSMQETASSCKTPEKPEKGEKEDDLAMSEMSFAQKINRKFQQYQRHKDSLYQPTKPHSRIQMSLTRRKDFRNTLFVCSVVKNGQSLTMATKRQSSLKCVKYEISMQPDFLEEIESEPFYLGRMEYRDGIYSFMDDGRFQVHTDEMIERRMGSLQISRPLVGNDTLVLLTPAIENDLPCIIEANELSCLFESFKRCGSVTKIAKYQPSPLSPAQWQSTGKMMGLRKSKHSIALRNSRSELNSMVLGRSTDTEFKMEVYEGLSPFQAFCTAVAWLS